MSPGAAGTQRWFHRKELAQMPPWRATHVDEGAFPTRRQLRGKKHPRREKLLRKVVLGAR